MAIVFVCGGCGLSLRIADGQVARKAKCPVCGRIEEAPVEASRSEPLSGTAADAGTAGAYRVDLPRPRQGPPREEDTDEEAVHAPGKPAPRRKKSRGKRTLLLGLGLLCLAGAVAATWYFFLTPQGLGDEEKYLPNHFTTLSSTRPERLLSSRIVQEMKEKMPLAGPEQLEEGFTSAEVNRLTWTHGSDGQVKVFVLRNATTADEVKAKNQGGPWQEEQVSGRTLYTAAPAIAFCVPEAKVVLFGHADLLRQILQRNGKPELTDAMRRAMKLADFSKANVSIRDVSGLGAHGAGEGIGGLHVPLPVDGAEAVITETDFDSDITSTTTTLCKDLRTAQELAQVLLEAQNEMKQMMGDDAKEQLNDQKVSTVGTKVIVKSRTTVEEFKSLGAGQEPPPVRGRAGAGKPPPPPPPGGRGGRGGRAGPPQPPAPPPG